jgi:hypothetical protein
MVAHFTRRECVIVIDAIPASGADRASQPTWSPRWITPCAANAVRLLALALVLSTSAACAHGPLFVAVPEARFRSEVALEERITLPLDPEGRARLLAFLRAGGDRDRIGTDVVDPAAATRYGPLLDRLSDASSLSLAHLTEKATYNAWFGDRRVRQVVDARAEAPPAIDPVAATDGQYWWVFSHRQKRLASLLVVKAVGKRLEH